METCPTCNEGVLRRRNAEGVYVPAQNPSCPNESASVRLCRSVELPVCDSCESVHPLGREDEVALAEVLKDTWELRLRRRVGLRIFADDEMGLGLAWAPCQDGMPVRLYLFGCCISLGTVPGDEPRFEVWSTDFLNSVRALWERQDEQDPPDTVTHRWEAAWRRLDTLPILGGRLRVPEYVGLGVSFWSHRWWNLLSWSFHIHVAGWRGHAGRVVRQRWQPPRVIDMVRRGSYPRPPTRV